jgi:multidrug efflux pump subunit AcrA (membrane-fusion protein)
MFHLELYQNNRSIIMKEKGSTAKKVVVFFAVLFVAAGFVFLPSLLAQTGGGQSGQPGPGRPGGPGGMPGGPGVPAAADTIFSVRTTEAVNKDLQAYLEINGNIVNDNQVALNPDMGGKLVSLRVSLGSRVQKGDVIAEVDPSKPGSSYSLSPVIVPIAGIVVSAPASIGSTVTTASTIVMIAGSGGLEIEAFIPEREVGQLKAGLNADVTLEAFPGETFSARVTQVSPIVDPNSRTKKIIFTFTNDDDRINAGMFARIKLNTRTYTNVITIPAEALVELRGRTGVYALDSADGVRFCEVNAGVTVDGETEIRSGLESGTAVVVQGQQFLTDGAKVRIIGRNT